MSYCYCKSSDKYMVNFFYRKSLTIAEILALLEDEDPSDSEEFLKFSLSLQIFMWIQMKTQETTVKVGKLTIYLGGSFKREL